MSVLFFFFFKQKTAYEMRISDWSSDVCSSDLRARAEQCGRTRWGVAAQAQKLGGAAARGPDRARDAERADLPARGPDRRPAAVRLPAGPVPAGRGRARSGQDRAP